MTSSEFIVFLIQTFNYSLECAVWPVDLVHCFNFWAVSFFTTMFILAYIIFYAIRIVLRDKAEFKAYEKRLADRARVATPEELKKVQWQVDTDYSDIDVSELASKMRQQLNLSK